jgi:hypothetical protein
MLEKVKGAAYDGIEIGIQMSPAFQPRGANITLSLYPGFDPYRSLATTLEATL